MKAFNINVANKKRKKFKIEKPNPIALFAFPFIILLLVLVAFPMVLVFFESIILEKNDMFQFTFDNFKAIFVNSEIAKAIFRSFRYAFIATAICLLMGYPFAYFLSKTSRKYRGVILLMVTATMWINTTLRLQGIQSIVKSDLLAPLDLINQGGAVTIGLVYIYLPFMIIPIYTSLIKIEKAHIEASMDLGSTPSETFFKVTFPLSFSGVLSGITMVLLPTATTIVVPKLLFNQANGQFIGQYIENQVVTVGNYGLGSAISLILAGLITIMSITANHFDRYARISETEDR